jgi:hypothetical protein
MALLKLNSYSGEADIVGIPRRISVDGDGLHICGVSLEEASDLLRVLGGGEVRAVQPEGTHARAMEFVFAPTHAKCACRESSVENDPCEDLKEASESEPESEPKTEKPEEQKAEEEPKPKRRTRAASKKPTKVASVASDMMKDPKETVTGSPEDPEDDSIIVDPEEEAGETMELDSASEKEAEQAVEVEPEEEESQISEEASGEDASEKSSKTDDQSPLFGQLLAAATMREAIIAFQDHGIVKFAAIQKEAMKYKDSVPLFKNAGSSLPVRLTRTAKGMGLK